jgi:1,6-anhydro-N-acetylmuramate kinase
LVRQYTDNKETIDYDGKYSSLGNVSHTILRTLHEKSVMQNGMNYFKISGPKALDVNDITIPLEIYNLSIEDGCRTLARFTAETIVQSVLKLESPCPKNWVLVGGGWKNPSIVSELQSLLTDKIDNFSLCSTNWNLDTLEAELIAYLSIRALLGIHITLPNITGAKASIIGGVLHRY